MDPKEGVESIKDEKKIVDEGGDVLDTNEGDEEDDDIDHLIWDTGKSGPHEFEETHFNKPTYCRFNISLKFFPPKILTEKSRHDFERVFLCRRILWRVDNFFRMETRCTVSWYEFTLFHNLCIHPVFSQSWFFSNVACSFTAHKKCASKIGDTCPIVLTLDKENENDIPLKEVTFLFLCFQIGQLF
jgi:hypothetical protein